ncbi:MAG: GntR family transcriptional regulator [Clostridia bacterium]|nr:GntR family transcriptional regulator [Clostridia bacterium]
MFHIATGDKTPIYEQLCRQVREQIALGVLEPGAPLPSVRSVSSSLGINPNTIQRAYRMMEEEGLTVSIPGKGSFVTLDTDKRQEEQRTRQCRRVRQELTDLKKLGVSREAALQLVMDVYEGKEEK